MIRKGEAWERPISGPEVLEVTGGDAELAAAVADHPRARVVFRPHGSDLARAVGIDVSGRDHPEPGTELALDALRWPDGLAVNAIVAGVAPDRARRWTRSRQVTVAIDGQPLFDGRATAVVIANGQFLRNRDVIPRGHPGDGRLEIQVYAVGVRERGIVRRRLETGTHVPHPAITTATGTRVELQATRSLVLEVDGRPAGRVAALAVDVLPDAFRLVV